MTIIEQRIKEAECESQKKSAMLWINGDVL